MNYNFLKLLIEGLNNNKGWLKTWENVFPGILTASI